jgi:hypothetical protein
MKRERDLLLKLLLNLSMKNNKVEQAQYQNSYADEP